MFENFLMLHRLKKLVEKNLLFLCVNFEGLNYEIKVFSFKKKINSIMGFSFLVFIATNSWCFKISEALNGHHWNATKHRIGIE